MRLLLGALLVPYLLSAQSYDWPIPEDIPQWINGTFCECRASGEVDRHHFHDGIDIHLPQGREVYSVIDGTVTSIGTAAQYGINSYIRVGRYAYVHVDANPTLAVGDSVFAYRTIIGTTNSWNHIHFKDGHPGNERNPIRQGGGLTPIEDIYPPFIFYIKFFPYNSEQEFVSRKVYGRIDIVARAMDRTDSGPIGDNNGIYSIGYHILDSTGARITGQTPFTFDLIPASDSYTPIVYAPGSNTSTYIYEVTNSISQDQYIDVTYWPPGAYTAQVFTADPYGLTDTASVSLLVVEQDTKPPPPPRLLSAQGWEEGFRLTWEPVSVPDLAGYRLYYSYDGVRWIPKSIENVPAQGVVSYLVPTFSNELAIYFRLAAYDNASFANESPPSVVYGLKRSVDGTRVLIVDSFDRRDGGWTEPGHDLFVEITGRLETAFDMVADDYFRQEALDFSAYDAVIIHDGDDVAGIDSAFSQAYLSSDPASRVRWYMGTHLLASWPEITKGWQADLPQPASGPVALPRTLSLTWNGGVPLDPGKGRWQPDRIIPIRDEGLQPIVTDGVGRLFGVTDNNGWIVTSLPIETFGEAALMDSVMLRFEELLRTFHRDDNPVLPQRFSVMAFPNPFNQRLRLQMTSGSAVDVDLVVFNLLGEELWRGRESLPSGVSQIWLPEPVFATASSGIYLLQARYPADAVKVFRTLKITHIK